MDQLKGQILSYNSDEMDERDRIPADFQINPKNGKVTWIDFQDITQQAEIKDMCKKFGIHHLIIEDILNTTQMVKMDTYDDCIFLVLKMVNYQHGDPHISSEHISIILKENYVLSFQEGGIDTFSVVKSKIRAEKDNIRKFGPDFLCYELIDTVVDQYFQVIDQLGDIADDVEDELISKPERSTLQRIYFLKRMLMSLRKSVYPLRELTGGLLGCENGLISNAAGIYFHDIYDHLIQIADSIETYQDILSNMLDIYLSSVSNKTNDIMKVLTIFSTIFIPLTFLAGIYGMNFKNIPELNLPYGYLLFWILSGIITVCMLFFFHRKKWF